MAKKYLKVQVDWLYLDNLTIFLQQSKGPIGGTAFGCFYQLQAIVQLWNLSAVVIKLKYAWMTEVSLTLDHIRVGSLALVCASSIWFVFVFVFDFRFVEQGSLTLCVCVSSVLAWDTLTPPPHCVHTPLSQHRTIILFFLFFFFTSNEWSLTHGQNDVTRPKKKLALFVLHL